MNTVSHHNQKTFHPRRARRGLVALFAALAAVALADPARPSSAATAIRSQVAAPTLTVGSPWPPSSPTMRPEFRMLGPPST